MGPPNLQKFQIPLDNGQSSLEMAINLPLEIDGCIFQITGVSMGNPHAVVNIAEI
jgi:diaminopimelate epimerase